MRIGTIFSGIGAPEQAAAGVSDSRRYQQAGNSMTVAVVEMIFKCIDDALKGCVDNTSLFGGIQ